MSESGPHLTFIIGCTACGKSAVGYELARRLEAEVVVVDSMKVYRGMDIGTAKPSSEQQAAVRYHLIDVVEPWDAFNAASYVELADRAIADIHARGRLVLVVGGTALYIMALSKGLFEGPGENQAFRAELRARAQREGLPALHAELRGVDPEAAERIHPNDYRRIERALEVYAGGGVPISELQTQWARQPRRYACRFVGLRRDKDEQSRRINARVRRMVDAGLLDEVRALLAHGRALSQQASQAVGYAESIDHLAGRLPLEDAVERIKISTRRLAKQQRTWFRRFADVEWLDLAGDSDVADVVSDILTHDQR